MDSERLEIKQKTKQKSRIKAFQSRKELQNHWAAFDLSTIHPLFVLEKFVKACKEDSQNDCITPDSVCKIRGYLKEIGDAKLDSEENYDEALVYYEKARELGAFGHSDSKQEAEILRNLGVVKYHQWKYKEALDFYLQSLTIFETCSEHDKAKVLQNIGAVKFNQEEYDEAWDPYFRAWQIFHKNKKKDDEAAVLQNMATIQCEKGEYKEAMKKLQQAYSILEPDPQKRAVILQNMGFVEYEQLQLDTALKYYEQARKILERNGKKREVAEAWTNMANVESEQGDHVKASEYLRNALQNYKEAFKDDRHPSMAIVLRRLCQHNPTATELQLVEQLLENDITILLGKAEFNTFDCLNVNWKVVEGMMKFYNKKDPLKLNSFVDNQLLLLEKIDKYFPLINYKKINIIKDVIMMNFARNNLDLCKSYKNKLKVLFDQECQLNSIKVPINIKAQLIFIQRSIQKLYNQLLESGWKDIHLNTCSATEIFIQLLHILDQVWNSFLEKKCKISAREPYFPFKTSKISLLKHLREVTLFPVITKKEIKENFAKWYKTNNEDPWPKIMEFLCQKGVVNEEGLSLDINIREYVDTDDCNIWIISSEWLEEIQTKLRKKRNKVSHRKIYDNGEHFAGPVMKMMECFLELKILIKLSPTSWIVDNDYLDQTSWSTICQCRKWPKGFENEEIINWFLNELKKKGEFTKYPDCLKVIMDEQPFSYFKRNEFSDSWMDKLFHIANDSKHVRLTPIAPVHQHGNHQGFLREGSTKFEIEYCEPLPQLYSWSLFNIPSMSQISEVNERKCISIAARELLLEKKYFEHKEWRKGLEYYPLSDWCMEIVREDAATSTNKLRTKLTSELQNCHLYKDGCILESIEQLILMRSGRQCYNIVPKPDFQVDLLWLLEKSFEKVKSISETLLGDSQSPEVAPQIPCAKYFNACAQKEEDNQEYPGTEPLSSELIGFVLRKSLSLFIRGKPRKAVATLMKLADTVEMNHDWLFFYLIKRSVKYMKAWDGCAAETFKLEHRMISHLVDCKFYSQAALLIPGLLHTQECVKLPSNEETLLSKSQSVWKMNKDIKRERNKNGNIDMDIFLQLKTLRFDSEKLKWMGIKIKTQDCSDEFVLSPTQKGICAAAQAVIKLRNVMDQSFTRFFSRCIAQPNNQSCFNLQIPTLSPYLHKSKFLTRLFEKRNESNIISALDLKLGNGMDEDVNSTWEQLRTNMENEIIFHLDEKLRKMLIRYCMHKKLEELHEDCIKVKVGVSFTHYPAVVDYLCNMNDILQVIQKISNISKHVGLYFPTQQELAAYYADRDISQLLPFIENTKIGKREVSPICSVVDEGLKAADMLVKLLFSIPPGLSINLYFFSKVPPFFRSK